MLKNISKLEVKVYDRVYQLLCDNDSPIDHVKEAILQFQKYVEEVEYKAKEAQEKEKTEEVSART